MTLRAAVLGTGAWARSIHLPGLAARDDVELVGVWGRNDAAVDAAAVGAGVPGTTDLDALLSEVDLVSIAVAPVAQGPLAVAAARAGVHLVVEKPAAADAAGARELERVARGAGVAAGVFVSRLWDPARRDWLAAAAAGSWSVISYSWVSAGMRPGMPGAHGWRKEVGPLVDVAPHVISIVEHLAGPVVGVLAAEADSEGRVRLELKHGAGAVTSAVLDLFADVPSTREVVRLEGDGAVEEWRNADAVDFPAAYAALVDDVVAQATGSAQVSPMREGSSLARAVTTAEVLDEAARLLAT